MPRKYTEEQRARKNKANRAWHKRNRDTVLPKQRAYNRTHHAELAAQKRVHRHANIDTFREKVNARTRRYRLEIVAFFGGRCIQCGFADWRALQLDHIHGDGHTEKGEMRQVHVRRKYILENPFEAKQRLQLLCANCNWIKRYERDENSHNRKL